MPDVDGNDVTVWCSESLSTTINLNGTIIDVIATPFELTGGMNSTALSRELTELLKIVVFTRL
jgi:hypothetical protein